MLFCATIASTLNPLPASSKVVQLDVIDGITGTGILSADSTVPTSACTGGTKVYHGVATQTGTKALSPKQVCPTSLYDVSKEILCWYFLRY